MTHDHPYLKIAPFKYEFLNRIPEIAYVHDFISKTEADKVLEVSRGKLKSTPYTYNGKYERYSKKRTSKVRYLSETHDKNAKKISDKVKQVTRFVMKGNLLDSENFQVMNYGLGGTIGIHIDESNKDGDRKNSTDPIKTRIMTFMTYLSDVESGGHTIFPQIGLSVKPVKGSALFWFNIHPAMVFDSRLVHLGVSTLMKKV